MKPLQVANQPGWSMARLEGLRAKLDRFERLLGDLAMVQLESVHEAIRYKGYVESRPPVDVCKDMATQFGPDRFVTMLATRRTLAYNYAFNGHARLGSGNLDLPVDAVPIPAGGWSDDPVQITEYLPSGNSVLIDFCGISQDPDFSLSVDLPTSLKNSELLGFGGSHTGLYSSFRSQVIAPLVPNASHPSLQSNNRLEALMRSQDQKTQALVSELRALFNDLSPICSADPFLCQYSPSSIWNLLVQGLEAQRTRAESDCMHLTGNDLSQASIYDAHFTRPVVPAAAKVPAPAGPGCAHESADFDLDYATSVEAFEQLSQNISHYKAARRCWLDYLLEKAAAQVKDEMWTDPVSGDPLLRYTGSEERTARSLIMSVAVRHRMSAGFDVPKDAAGNALLAGALDNFCNTVGGFEQEFAVITSILGSSNPLISGETEIGAFEALNPGGVLRPFSSTSLDIKGKSNFLYQVDLVPGDGLVIQTGSELEGHIIAQARTPFVFNLLGFDIGGALRLTASLEGNVSSESRLGLGYACDPQRGAPVSVAAGLAADVEASAELFAINVGILEAGVRGVAGLVEVDFGVDFESEVSLEDIFNAPQLVQRAFDCDPSYYPDVCTRPNALPLLDFELDRLNASAKGELFGGRIELFARLNLLFVNPEAALPLITWKGRAFDPVPELEEAFSAGLNQGLLCHPLLFDNQHPACP